MPLYEFQCESCGFIVEKITKPEVKETTCPKCGQVAKQILSVPSPMVWGRGGRGF